MHFSVLAMFILSLFHRGDFQNPGNSQRPKSIWKPYFAPLKFPSEKASTDDIPPSPLSAHIHRPAKLLAWAPTAPVSLRTHQVSLNRWIKPNPRLVYYLSQEPNPGKFPWSNLYVTEVEESLFPCLIPTQSPTKRERYLGAITKQTTKAERRGASMCCWHRFVQDGSSPAGHPGVPHLSSQWIFSKGGHQPGQKHESVSPF